MAIVASHSVDKIRAALNEFLIRLVLAAGGPGQGGQENTADRQNNSKVSESTHVFLLD
jgi:hypothetical protein